MKAVEIKTQFRPLGNLQITTRLKNTIRIMVGCFSIMSFLDFSGTPCFSDAMSIAFALYLCWCQSLNCEIVTSIFLREIEGKHLPFYSQKGHVDVSIFTHG